MAVVVLLAILSSIIIGAGRHAVERGRTSRAKAELAALSALLESYRATHGDYPRTDNAAYLLQSLLGRRDPDYQPTSGRAWLETSRFTLRGDPWTDETAVLVDSWGQPYHYAYKSAAGWTNPGFVLGSAGPDQVADDRLLSGGFPDASAPGNADNLLASRP